jgi:hypothetical protein
VLNWMYDAEMAGGIELKATCAPHYFRIVRQRQAEERRSGIFRERPVQPPSPAARAAATLAVIPATAILAPTATTATRRARR